VKRFIFVAGVVLIVLLVFLGRAETSHDTHLFISQALDFTGAIIDLIKWIIHTVTS